MSKLRYLGYVLLVGGVAACQTAYHTRDAIIGAEKSGRELVCKFHDPAATITFNYQHSGRGSGSIGNGKVQVKLEDGQAQNHVRVRTDEPLSFGFTPFKLDTINKNYVQGVILDAPGNTCRDYRAGTANPYHITVTGGYGYIYLQKKGCCSLQ